MKIDGKPYCDICKQEMVMQQGPDEWGHEPWPLGSAIAHVCEDCFDEAFSIQWEMDNPCGSCETRPCERGRDCWYTPPILRQLPYETYYATLAK